MKITLKKFEKSDIPNKIKWINNPENNKYLHYELPLVQDKTEMWYERIKDDSARYDAVIMADDIPVGLIGLLCIDNKNSKAEYYIVIGEKKYRGKGIADKASNLILEYAFKTINLNRIYLYTETENTSATKLYERVGFKMEGIIKNDLYSKGKYVNRFIYGISKDDYYKKIYTPIYKLDDFSNNVIYIKRDDFIPFSFGGNKARKAQLFFEDINRGNYDCVVTYGSSSSNHCRIIANMAVKYGLKCFIVSPEEKYTETFNSKLIRLFKASVITCPLNNVHNTIEKTLNDLKNNGNSPYFIPGGGHGNIGTQAYVDCYNEIHKYERKNNIKFDYIFHASGTGTTQAGLICGKLINGDNKEIIGISIARKNPRGRNTIIASINDYLSAKNLLFSKNVIENSTVFIDKYTDKGYGDFDISISTAIENTMFKYGIPLDTTYTGKAYAGMFEYIKDNNINNKNILFIHTGGMPLFFDYIDRK